FTSARLKSEGLQEFTFGRVEVRAKLPEGVGTWPAIWMLGADYQTNPWPGTGEIDIMEHVGRNQNEVLSTLHFPGNSGANGISQSTTVNDVAGTFHVYATEWTETQIRFYVDDELYHLFQNDSQKPFDKDFFMILNVAMGGNLGGDVDPAFTQSSMQVDYVRVYQRD
ncbi:MAG: glycoside hydrolase family 16 protein, partial [Leeuwenhoekiella sp.]|nr:glycoside hydrolase family 16 protein [Leeuwenhoekiella sp.]